MPYPACNKRARKIDLDWLALLADKVRELRSRTLSSSVLYRFMRLKIALCTALLFSTLGATPVISSQKTFFVRIHPARANFLKTMTPAEGDAMNRHFAYWKARMGEHRLILAGPVPIDPGTFGILIVRAADLTEAERLVAEDPSIKAHVNDYEIYPLVLSLYEGNAAK